MKDSRFLAQTSMANLDVDSVGGEDLEKLVNDYFHLDAAVVNKRREILK